jgi:hypothetical protein
VLLLCAVCWSDTIQASVDSGQAPIALLQSRKGRFPGEKAHVQTCLPGLRQWRVVLSQSVGLRDSGYVKLQGLRGVSGSLGRGGGERKC